jgi:tRNA pseudouridine38-40 synthase
LGEERRIKLTLHYDGAGFFGWQVQPDARTVQAELEAALSRLIDKPVSVVAAGRTDRGVHATGQVASALVPDKWTAAMLQRSLNAILPEDIWVASAVEVPAAFHARYDATARSYFYRVGTVSEASSPFQRRWCWPVRDEPDLDLLCDAASRIVGERSFAAFAKTGQEERGDRCTVTRAEWSRWEYGVQLDITANRFLHHMVRYLVGTMMDVALRRRPVSDMDQLLNQPGDLETSPPAPPEGLFLAGVSYGSANN